MKQNLSMWVLMSVGLISCDTTDPIAPPTSEQMAVSVQHRTSAPGEQVPTVRITGAQGTVTVAVTRRGMCATLVDAGISRAPGELAVVARVSSNPAALCALLNVETVVDYSGTISSVPGGLYRVRVFEAEGGGSPRLIGSATVTASGIVALQ